MIYETNTVNIYTATSLHVFVNFSLRGVVFFFFSGSDIEKVSLKYFAFEEFPSGSKNSCLSIRFGVDAKSYFLSR